MPIAPEQSAEKAPEQSAEKAPKQSAEQGPAPAQAPGPDPEHVDVLVIGAGLSGIGAACRLRADCPDLSFAVLEARESSGGTWDLFRFPGIRSDSDMFTLAYDFRPWTGPTSITDGATILQYLRDTARLHGVEAGIRYRHRVLRASWSSDTARWRVTGERPGPDGGTETFTVTCGFLFGNTGYYRYDEGYAPAFTGAERFTGRIVHPQHWPPDLDHTGLRVVVIGSGATAVTLVPALCAKAAQVTMLQRSPSYLVSLGTIDALADRLRRRLPERLAARLVRAKSVLSNGMTYQLSRHLPRAVSWVLRRRVRQALPAGYPVGTHFAPDYQPWDQRLCVVRDGDLFRAITAGRASVVTDQITTFTENGILLASGRELEADLIVTATGLNLQVAGGVRVDVDGRPVNFADTVSYKGVMFSGVPNLALTIGYTHASWTLKAGLTAGYVCRLLNFMGRHGYPQCTPTTPDPALPTEPLITLRSGYIKRALPMLPRKVMVRPWRLRENYPLDLLALRYGRLTDDGITFTAARPAAGSSSAK